MTDTISPVWWRTHPSDLPASSNWIVIDEDAFQESERRITGRHRLPCPVPDWAEDLFRVARAAFLADKHVRRTGAGDRWTRRIHLSVPVSGLERWQDPMAQHHLAALLQTLTGDMWDVAFRRLTRNHVQEAFPYDERACEVALFSGGLDSLSWAATRAHAVESRPLLLVMFCEIKLRGLQRQVYESVERLSAGRRVLRLEMAQTPAGDRSRQRLETSSRTRGLLYAAGAIRAATAHGVGEIQIPENGFLALNPPLTPARSAACSTRSVHPRTLRYFNALMAAINDTWSPVRVINPLSGLTKGEVCRAALDAGLSPVDLGATVSCGRPPVRRKRRTGEPRFANCGVCFPCLVRRSGLEHAIGADHTRYESSLWADGLPDSRTEDRRALQRWLLEPYGRADLLADTPLPSGTDTAAALDVINRGRKELKHMIDAASDAAA